MKASPWFHRTTIYQIYPRSFYDSNGDGLGDLQGIMQKLDYVQRLGFEVVWCSPFFVSPQADFGYDVSDYQDISPDYGSREQAVQLVQEIHRRGMKIIFDLVLNHTSAEHPWFQESRSSRENPKADWYLWRDRRNNWQSMTGGSGWHYARERDQYYWASFLPFQPDLNYRNPQVKAAMLDIVRYWLEKGVDGFRLDIFNVLFKDAKFRDNPFSFHLIPTEGNPAAFLQQPKYTLNQPESYAFARELRAVCEEFGEKLLLGEVNGGRAAIRKFMGAEKNDGLPLVFDFEMMDFEFSAAYFRRLIEDIELHYPDPFMPVYVFSNHDRSRSIRRLGNDFRKARLLQLMQYTVRGVPCCYYGEELGMTNLKLPLSTALDPIAQKFRSVPHFVFDLAGVTINRDEVRTPMQWDGSQAAGFSTSAKPWLPVHPNYREINVASEVEEPESLLNTIRQLLAVRKEHPALQNGPLKLLDPLPDGILGYRRLAEEAGLRIFLNFGPSAREFSCGPGDCIFQLSGGDSLKNGQLRLCGYGGVILKG